MIGSTGIGLKWLNKGGTSLSSNSPDVVMLVLFGQSQQM